MAPSISQKIPETAPEATKNPNDPPRTPQETPGTPTRPSKDFKRSLKTPIYSQRNPTGAPKHPKTIYKALSKKPNDMRGAIESAAHPLG